MINLFLIVFSTIVLAQTPSITSKNIEGQKKLFEKGWFIITSPVEAWDYALENNEQSGEAFKRAINKIKPSKETFSERLESARQTSKEIKSAGEKISKTLLDTGAEVQKKSFQMSSESFKKSWKRLNLGYVSYVKTNEDDLESIKKINTEFFGRVKTDFKSIEDGMKPVLGHLLEKSEVPWKKYFKEGKYSFVDQYEKSGTRENSLTGLWDILVGYASWTYKAIFTPTAKTIYQETKNIPYYSIDLVLKTFIASHNVIYSLGANVYYTSKLGYKIISPSLEAGYLSSLALLGVLNGSITSNLIRSAGLINKVAVKSAAPLVAGSQLTIEEVSSRAQDAATYLAHGSMAVGEVVFEKVDTGVVLGYSALSQIPPQLLLMSINSAIFLVYDGPKLFIVKVSGMIGDKKIDEVPVGTVMDMRKMKEEGLQIETLSKDPEIIKKVLEHVE